MCKRSNYTQNSPQYEGDCEYRITSNKVFRLMSSDYRTKELYVCRSTGDNKNNSEKAHLEHRRS